MDVEEVVAYDDEEEDDEVRMDGGDWMECGGIDGCWCQRLLTSVNRCIKVPAGSDSPLPPPPPPPQADSGKAAAAPRGGLLSSFVRSIGVNLAGTAALTRADIDPALAGLKRKLMERNVAEEIADK